MSETFEIRQRKALDGMKPYVPGKPIAEVRRELGLDDVIKMASNENPLGPSPKALEAMVRALPEVHYYPDGACRDLVGALGEEIGLPSDHFLVGNGSDEVIKLLGEAFLEPGDRGIVGNPTFSEYRFALTLMGAETVGIPLTEDDRHDLSAMADAVDDRTRVVFVCNPNNPTGTTVTQGELDDFLHRIPPHVLVVLDQAYQEYADPDSFADGIPYVREGRKNILVLRTFSKIHGLGGLRVGYGIGHPDLLSCLFRVREPFNVNVLAQTGALAALGDRSHQDSSRRINEEGIRTLTRALGDRGFSVTPTQANFLWIDLKRPCGPVFDALLAQGVIVRTGDVFGYPRHIRLTVGTPSQNERFLEALDRAGAASPGPL